MLRGFDVQRVVKVQKILKRRETQSKQLKDSVLLLLSHFINQLLDPCQRTRDLESLEIPLRTKVRLRQDYGACIQNGHEQLRGVGATVQSALRTEGTATPLISNAVFDTWRMKSRSRDDHFQTKSHSLSLEDQSSPLTL